MDDYITVKDFANLAGVSTQAIYQRIDKDLKGFVKVENGKKTYTNHCFGVLYS